MYHDSTHKMNRQGLPGLKHCSVKDLSWTSSSVSLSSVVCELVADVQSKILPVIRPEWAPEALGYRVFEEGVWNKLLGFFHKGNTEDMVLVRVNKGVGKDLLKDSETELIVMLTMHKAGLSPPVYLVTENALCYGYITGQALTLEDLQTDSVLRATACAVAQFHAVPVPDPLQGRKPQVWAKIDQWMELVTGEFSNEKMTKRFTQAMGSVEHLKHEVDWLKRELGADRHTTFGGLLQDEDGMGHRTEGSEHLPCDSHTVLCHNDPQPLNIILSPDGTASLIDFEYSGENYPAFDIGDFFCFHGTVDFSRYPSESVQKTWITYYLEECARMRGDDPIEISSDQVHSLYRDANKFALAAHFMWTLWSLILCKHSTTDFDCLEYGCIRYEEYQRRKKLVF